MFGGKLGFRVRARLLAELKLTLLGKFAGFSVHNKRWVKAICYLLICLIPWLTLNS